MRSLRRPAQKQTEKTLKKSEKKFSKAEVKQADEASFRYSSIMESSDDAIIAKNLEGVISAWNRSAQRMFGYTETEAIGQSIRIIVPPELHDEEKDILRRLRAGERIEHYETRRVSKSGKNIEVSITFSPIRDAGGKIIAVSSIARDITESKRAQAALRESEERFRLVANTAPVMIWMSGTDKLCTYFNKRWLDFTGRSLAQERGNGWAEGVDPEDLQMCKDTYTRAFDRREEFGMEYRLRRNDGEYRWIFDIGVPRFNADHSFAGYIGSCVDITERKLAERELALASERLRLVMHAGKAVGWDWDIKSGRDSWFGDLRSMFGMPSETHVGSVEELHRHIHPEDRVRVREAAKDAMESKKPYAAEYRILWPDGTVRWVAVKGKFYYSPDGVPERMLGMKVDVTDRKLAEEALRESEERFRLAAQAGRMYAFDWDVITDVIVRSEESTHIFGLTGEPIKLTKRELLERVHPEDRATFTNSIVECTPESPNTQISYRLLRPDRSVLWLERTGHAFFDEEGRMVRMIGMVADITERKLAEDKLQEYERAVEGLEEMIVVVDREYRYLIANNKFLKMRNMTKGEVVGRFAHEVLNKEVFEAVVKEKLDDCFQGKVVRYEMKYTYPELGERDLLVSYFPIEGATGVDRVACIMQDITERKLAEEALSTVSQKLIEAHEEERTRIARELHDDVGQRLVLLAWHLGSSNGNLRKQIEDLANDVQALSHQLHSPKLELLGLAAAAAGFCKELSDRQRVEIEFHSENIPKELPQEISLCLFRVLQEALQNAIKHSGSRQFQVSLRRGASEIELTVHDSGIGFETDEAIKGPGLGLTSMQERLKLVDGQLFIESKPQRGATIQARVPLRPEMKSVASVG